VTIRKRNDFWHGPGSFIDCTPAAWLGVDLHIADSAYLPSAELPPLDQIVWARHADHRTSDDATPELLLDHAIDRWQKQERERRARALERAARRAELEQRFREFAARLLFFAGAET